MSASSPVSARDASKRACSSLIMLWMTASVFLSWESISMSATNVHGWQEGGNAGWGIRVAARERGSPCAIVHEYAFIIEVDKPERNTLSRNYDNFLTYEQDIHILYAAAAGVYYITMLEQLFGSRTRIKLLKIFLAQPTQLFFVRELTRAIGERINSVRREIANLIRLGVVIQRGPEEVKNAHESAHARSK